MTTPETNPDRAPAADDGAIRSPSRPRRRKRTIATAGAGLLAAGCVVALLANAVHRVRESAERAH